MQLYIEKVLGICDLQLVLRMVQQDARKELYHLEVIGRPS